MIDNYMKDLEANGFILIPNLLSSVECDQYKRILEDDYAKYSPLYFTEEEINKGTLANKSSEKVVFNLHNKDLSWFKIFEHSKIISILDILLKQGSYKNMEPYYLNNISARSPQRGGGEQQLHLDSNLPGVNYCLFANVLWMLDDFTEENGATRVVPGSHKWSTYPETGKFHKDEIRITGKKGSAIIFNANLWHGGAANTTDYDRWAVVLGYARWFMKPSFDYMKNMPMHVFNSLSDNQKSLLGFHLTPPKDEFTRMRRKSKTFEIPKEYELPSEKG